MAKKPRKNQKNRVPFSVRRNMAKKGLLPSDCPADVRWLLAANPNASSTFQRELDEADDMRVEFVRCATDFFKATETDNLENVLEVVLQAQKAAPQLPEGYVNCKEGCAFCCHMRVEIVPAELILIYKSLEHGLSKVEFENLAKDVAEMCEQGKPMETAWWFDTQAPCPLLILDEKACAIYEIRPLSCRAFTSFDASICEATYQDGEAREVPRSSTAMIFCDGLSMALTTAYEGQGLEGYRVEMVTGLNMLFKDPGLIDRWLQGEKVFAAAVPADTRVREDFLRRMNV